MENGLRTCVCGTEIEGEEPRCANCGKLQDIVDEDFVTPVVVKDDESASWLEPDLFSDEKYNCSKDIGEFPEHCNTWGDDQTGTKSIAIQADLSFDPSSILESSMHISEGEFGQDEADPLDKSVQVSEILLDQAGSVVASDYTNPYSEANLQSENDLCNCLDCGNPIRDEASADVCFKCRENRTGIVPPSPFQDNRVENSLQRTSNPDLKFSFPDCLDETSNYTDRDTDVQTRATDATGTETDSLANAARIRQGNRNETTEVIGRIKISRSR